MKWLLFAVVLLATLAVASSTFAAGCPGGNCPLTPGFSSVPSMLPPVLPAPKAKATTKAATKTTTKSKTVTVEATAIVPWQAVPGMGACPCPGSCPRPGPRPPVRVWRAWR